MILSSSVIKINAAAPHFVILASVASSVFDLFLARNVSDPPPSAPDRPEVFPDWIRTIAVTATQMIMSIIMIAVTKINTPKISALWRILIT